MLAEADYVVATIHYGLKQKERQLTDRLLGAITHQTISVWLPARKAAAVSVSFVCCRTTSVLAALERAITPGSTRPWPSWKKRSPNFRA